ncbi:MAG: glutamate mutase L [Methylibium sp.]|uniref:methylaspartate mutase accessory protein GlmL n=1 Tax=Methylibium sp. TaxID=2067992 RepID=UPI001823A7F9|nr:methylaspartate mutase accessory protein GlmL [Methylibium sp.]MBA3596149.1 glutamate mutase L [Methylibium sp.]
MNFALLVDFGSTWTKVRAVDLDEARVVASAQGPSTVASDVTVGLEQALARLHATLGHTPRYRLRLGSSSAAGGLKMVTMGLVRELTAEAARQAALGAGARLVASFAYRLTRADLRQIERLQPDIVLLCGGTDGGNREIIVHNARALAASGLACPVVVAGNRDAGDEIAELLPDARLCANVMPEFNVLAIEPARAAIRDVFMSRIVHAKGIDRARGLLDDVVLPTPAAVLEGAELLAGGPNGNDGLGPLVVVDPGGATTDVHSVGEGEPAAGVVRLGLPEPHAKRTVEGDLGMRHNAASIVESCGAEAIAAGAGIATTRLHELLAAIAADVERLPANAEEHALDRSLARTAIRLAMRRHAGTIETVHTAHGPVQVQRGKDLARVATLIGTGGVIVHAAQPGGLLDAALADRGDPHSLGPVAAQLYVDRDYALFASGLLARADRRVAFELARNGLVLTENAHHVHHASI